MSLEHEQITSSVLAAAIEVHRELGPGFLETVYDHALAVEPRKRQIRFERQVEVAVVYDGVQVGSHRLDLLVADTVVVELKAVRELADVHFAVVRSQLRATGLHHGLLINFAKPVLEAKRVLARTGLERPAEARLEHR